MATYFKVPHETAASWRRHDGGETMWIFDEVEEISGRAVGGIYMCLGISATGVR